MVFDDSPSAPQKFTAVDSDLGRQADYWGGNLATVRINNNDVTLRAVTESERSEYISRV